MEAEECDEEGETVCDTVETEECFTKYEQECETVFKERCSTEYELECTTGDLHRNDLIVFSFCILAAFDEKQASPQLTPECAIG